MALVKRYDYHIDCDCSTSTGIFERNGIMASNCTCGDEEQNRHYLNGIGGHRKFVEINNTYDIQFGNAGCTCERECTCGSESGSSSEEEEEFRKKSIEVINELDHAIESKYNALRADIINLRKKNEQLEKDLSNAKQLNLELTARLDFKDVELKAYEEKTEMLENENRELQENVNTLNSKLALAISESNELKLNVNALNHEIKQLMTKIENLSKEKEKVEVELREIKSKHDQAINKLRSEYNSQIDALRRELQHQKDEFERRINELENEISELSDENTNLSNQVRDFEVELEAKVHEIKSLNEKLQDLKKQISNMKIDLQEAHEQRNALQSENSKFKSEISTLNKEISSLKSKLEESERKYEQKAKEIEKLLVKITKFTTEIEEMRVKLRHCDELKIEFQNLQEVNGRISEENKNLNLIINEWREKHERIERELFNSKQETERSNQEVSRLNIRVYELSLFEEKFNQSEAEKEKLKEEISSLTNINLVINAQINEKNKELEETKEKLKICEEKPVAKPVPQPQRAPTPEKENEPPKEIERRPSKPKKRSKSKCSSSLDRFVHIVREEHPIYHQPQQLVCQCIMKPIPPTPLVCYEPQQQLCCQPYVCYQQQQKSLECFCFDKSSGPCYTPFPTTRSIQYNFGEQQGSFDSHIMFAKQQHGSPMVKSRRKKNVFNSFRHNRDAYRGPREDILQQHDENDIQNGHRNRKVKKEKIANVEQRPQHFNQIKGDDEKFVCLSFKSLLNYYILLNMEKNYLAEFLPQDRLDDLENNLLLIKVDAFLKALGRELQQTNLNEILREFLDSTSISRSDLQNLIDVYKNASYGKDNDDIKELRSIGTVDVYYNDFKLKREYLLYFQNEAQTIAVAFEKLFNDL